MYRKEEKKIKTAFDDVAPDLFESIKRSEYKKIESEEELFGEWDDSQEEKQTNIVPLRPRVAWGSVAAVLLCFLIWTQLVAPRVQATQVMIDVNSKMQFVVTEKRNGIEIQGCGEEGKKIAKNISPETTLEDAVNAILIKLDENNCFAEEDSGILVSYVETKKEESKKKISKVLRDFFQEKNQHVSLAQQEIKKQVKDTKKAEEQGVSVGKYCFLQDVQDKYQIDAKEMYQKGMGDIFHEINQQGIDLSKDNRVEYSPGNETDAPKKTEDIVKEQDASGTGKKSNKKSFEKKSSSKKQSFSEKKSLKEKKKNQKKTEVPSDDEREENGNSKDEGTQNGSSVSTPPVPESTFVPENVTGEGLETSGIIATPTPVVTAAPEKGHDEEKDLPKDHSQKNPGGKIPEMNAPAKNPALDWDVDEIREQIREQMKKHPSRKKQGYTKSQEKIVGDEVIPTEEVLEEDKEKMAE